MDYWVFVVLTPVSISPVAEAILACYPLQGGRPWGSKNFVSSCGVKIQQGISRLYFYPSHYAYTTLSAISFILLWLGSAFLLQSYRKRLGTIKFWIIMSLPLLYFMSQFGSFVLIVLFSGGLTNPLLFSILVLPTRKQLIQILQLQQSQF